MLLSFVSAGSFSIILITFSSCNLQNIPAVVNVILLFSYTVYDEYKNLLTCNHDLKNNYL